MYQGHTPPPKKNRRPIDEIAPKKQNKNNNLNTEFTEMGVCSAVAGNQLPTQLQKRVLPSLFHLRCPSQSHQRSDRGRTRKTTVTSISCRSFKRQLLYLFRRSKPDKTAATVVLSSEGGGRPQRFIQAAPNEPELIKKGVKKEEPAIGVSLPSGGETGTAQED